MTPALVLLLLPCPAIPVATLQEPPEVQEPPAGEQRGRDPAEIPPEEALEVLDQAFSSKNVEAILQALETMGRVPDKKVVKEVGKAFQNRDARVRAGALQALRFNDAPEALSSLLKLARNKKLLEDKQFAAEYYLALGQKGDAKAIKVLADGLVVDNGGNPVIRARILALGHIRDRRAVEELMDFWVKGKARRAHPYARELSLALGVLTGENRRGRDQWIDWWNDNRRSFRIAEEEYELPRQYQRQWQRLWATPEEKAAAKEREKERRRDRDQDQD